MQSIACKILLILRMDMVVCAAEVSMILEDNLAICPVRPATRLMTVGAVIQTGK